MTLPHDSWAAHYEAVMELTFQELYARLTSSALDEVRARLRPPASIVDFGAGCGRLSIPLGLRRIPGHRGRALSVEALSGAGFETEADVTTRFADLGAEYLLLRSST